jgi:hypothetical protein
MNSNGTVRNETAARANELNAVYPAVCDPLTSKQTIQHLELLS